MDNKSDMKKMKDLLNTMKGTRSHCVDSDCSSIKASIVDLIEGDISPQDSKKLHAHMESCQECMNEYRLTQELLTNIKNLPAPASTNEDYFNNLEQNIVNITGTNIDLSVCETAQEHIADLIIGESIPADIKKHIESCSGCTAEWTRTNQMMSVLKNMFVPVPNEQFFTEQLASIDQKIETAPSHRIAKEEKSTSFASYISGIVDTFRVTILQPQVLAASTALVALIIVGARLHYSQESIEERQINLSEVLNKSSIVIGSTYNMVPDKISHPDEDKKLEIHSTGTAEIRSNKKTNKIN